MKKVTDATTDDGIGSGWFKIQHAGLTNVASETFSPPAASCAWLIYSATAQDWATTDLIANEGNQSITIPTCIEDGQYLLRAELIALHAGTPLILPSSRYD